MYGVVLMVALSGGADVPATHFGGGCGGCYGCDGGRCRWRRWDGGVGVAGWHRGAGADTAGNTTGTTGEAARGAATTSDAALTEAEKKAWADYVGSLEGADKKAAEDLWNSAK